MINEVIKETEESNDKENSVVETNTENSAVQPAEEIAASPEVADTAALEEPEISNAQSEASASLTESGEDLKAPDEPAQSAPTEIAETSPTLTEEAEELKAAEMDFGAILEEFEQDQEVFHIGKLVDGKVVGISDHGVLIDFGYKSEGLVASDEFASPEGDLIISEGDTVEVVIKTIYSGDAPPTLSYLDALRRKSWDAIEIAYNEEVPVNAYVVAKTKGGLRIDISGVEAFLPGSQVDSRPVRNLDSFIGKEIEAKVIKFSRKRNNIVISRKALTDEVMNKLKAETLAKVEEGYIVDGVVKNLTEYGAFVDLGGIDGLLHVTDMSWGRLQNPNEMFKVNDEIQIKILKLDREKEKVSLGFKQLLPDPWSTVVEVYPVDSTVKGVISSVTDYGAFVELEPGVEGLVHISEMSWSKRTKNPKKIVKPGEEVEVQVLGIDTDERRISLGMKQLQENPWDTIAERYQVGSRVRGRVRNLTDFGAFIEIEDGIDGLVHVSDISHSKKIKHPKDVLKRDQEVDAIVTNVDTQGHRLSLSIKELTPSTWDAFAEAHKPGDVVKGKVSRFAGFGVFVELDNDLEGLCHISELADERVEKPEDVVSIGQELDFKILRIEHDVQKIGLSARAVGKEDEPVVDAKSYSSEAKSGMASLGELINLKRGGQEDAGEDEADAPKLSKKERRAKKALEAESEVSDAIAEADAPVTGDEVEAVSEQPAEATAEIAEESADTTPEEAVSEQAAEAAPAEIAEETTAATPEEPAAVAGEDSEKSIEPYSETAPEASGAEKAPETEGKADVEPVVEASTASDEKVETEEIAAAEPAEKPAAKAKTEKKPKPAAKKAKPKTAKTAKKAESEGAAEAEVEPIAAVADPGKGNPEAGEEDTATEEKSA